MKPFLRAAALLVLASPAFADATKFITPKPSSPVGASHREPSRYAPYSRNTPRGQGSPIVPSYHDASRSGADHAAKPYSRNYPRADRRNA